MILPIKRLILQCVGGSLLLGGTYCSLEVFKVIIYKSNALLFGEKIFNGFVSFSPVFMKMFFQNLSRRMLDLLGFNNNNKKSVFEN